MRRLTLLALAGTLVLSACSDQDSQSPTEPTIEPPSETFGSTCDHGRYPLRSVALLIPAAFPTTLPGYKALRAEALVRVGAIALLWDFCKDRLARQAALKTIAWIDSRRSRLAAGGRSQGGHTGWIRSRGIQEDDFVTGFSFLATVPKSLRRPTRRDPPAGRTMHLIEPTLITVRRLPNDFQLTDFPQGSSRTTVLGLRRD